MAYGDTEHAKQLWTRGADNQMTVKFAVRHGG